MPLQRIRHAGLVLLLGAPLGAQAQGVERYEAQAFDRGDGRLRYTETHWRYVQDGAPVHVVMYGCPGEPGVYFARKRLRESPSAQAPDFDFQDARNGYSEGVQSPSGLRAGEREVHVQAGSGAALERRIIAVPAGAVLDAGFDNFVKARWPELSAGAGLTVPFLIPSRFEFLDFKIAGAQDSRFDGQDARVLRMKFAAWYGFALPSLELTYTRDGARLLAFQGLGTIRDEKGRNLDVRIVFPSSGRAWLPELTPGIQSVMASKLVTSCKGG